jgi:hypothetical protein
MEWVDSVSGAREVERKDQARALGVGDSAGTSGTGSQGRAVDHLTKGDVMKIGLWAVIAVAAVMVGCTHEVKMQIEDPDGRVRSYETYSEWGAGGEVWDCKQVAAGKRKATYTCEAMLMQR